MIALLLALLPTASAGLDESCDQLLRPENYDDQAQQDFLQNYFALNTTFSPVHAAIPHHPGRGAIGVDVGLIPPLNCWQRAAFDYTKTEDTNASPLLPRLRASFALPAGKWVVPYVGVAYMGPIPVGGLYNVTFGAELGVGFLPDAVVQPGLRVHASMIRTVGEVAKPFEEGEPAIDDLYVGSNVGVDVMVSGALPLKRHELTPFLSAGLLDVSTQFVVGDDGVLVANQHPYLGPAISIGLSGLFFDHLRIAGEVYSAPGGFSRPRALGPETADHKFGTYGHLTTVRGWLAWEFGGSRLGKKRGQDSVDAAPDAVAPTRPVRPSAVDPVAAAGTGARPAAPAPAPSRGGYVDVTVWPMFDGKLVTDTRVMLSDGQGDVREVVVGASPRTMPLPRGSTWTATAEHGCLRGTVAWTVEPSQRTVELDLVPEPTDRVFVNVRDALRRPIDATVAFRSPDCPGCVPDAPAPAVRGELITLACPGQHQVIVSAPDQAAVVVPVSVIDGQDARVDVALRPPRVMVMAFGIRALDPVLFDDTGVGLDLRGLSLLDEVAATLLAHPEISQVVVAGHSEATADPREAMDASTRRAQVVVDRLVQLGVSPSRLVLEGRGASVLVARGDTDEGLRANRRVTFEEIVPPSP